MAHEDTNPIGRAAGDAGVPCVIETVPDLDAVWPELRDLIIALEGYNAGLSVSRRFRADWEARSREHLVRRQPLILIARNDDSAVGYLIAFLEQDGVLFEERFVHVSEAFVLEAYRGRGIGRALLQRAEAWARERGADAVRLDVFAANRSGKQFWETAGFEIEVHQMRKTLGASS